MPTQAASADRCFFRKTLSLVLTLSHHDRKSSQSSYCGKVSAGQANRSPGSCRRLYFLCSLLNRQIICLYISPALCAHLPWAAMDSSQLRWTLGTCQCDQPHSRQQPYVPSRNQHRNYHPILQMGKQKWSQEECLAQGQPAGKVQLECTQDCLKPGWHLIQFQGPDKLWKPQAFSWSWGQRLMANLIQTGYVVIYFLKSFCFWCGLFKKSFIESVAVSFLFFMFWFFGLQAFGISAP